MEHNTIYVKAVLFILRLDNKVCHKLVHRPMKTAKQRVASVILLYHVKNVLHLRIYCWKTIQGFHAIFVYMLRVHS